MASSPPHRERLRELEDLFKENFPDVWKFARRRTTSSADADDVTAEVFATACRRHAELPGSREQRLWLFGVARYVLANHRRSSTRQNQLHARLMSLRHEAPVATEPRLDGELMAALAELSEPDRELLIMRSWDGFSVADIAALLEVTPNAVSLRLTKARQRLRRLLNETGFGDSGHEPDDPALPREGTANG